MVFRSEYLVSIPESGKASWNNIKNTLIISFFFFFFMFELLHLVYY